MPDPILTAEQVEKIAREWLWWRAVPAIDGGGWHVPNGPYLPGALDQYDPRFLWPLEGLLTEERRWEFAPRWQPTSMKHLRYIVAQHGINQFLTEGREGAVLQAAKAELESEWE